MVRAIDGNACAYICMFTTYHHCTTYLRFVRPWRCIRPMPGPRQDAFDSDISGRGTDPTPPLSRFLLGHVGDLNRFAGAVRQNIAALSPWMRSGMGADTTDEAPATWQRAC